MTDYTPKVGDRVRATLGENVLVGEVEYADGGGVELRCNGSLFPLYEDSWQFEQVVEMPTKVGAIVRRVDGSLWVRRDRDALPWGSLDGLFAEISNATVLNGGFTVLFEGVDE